LTAARGTTFVPAVVAERGAKASERFVTFFTDHIRNPNTRRAYHRAVLDFFDWCESRGLDFVAIKSFHVSAYIEWLLKGGKSKSSVKQILAAIRMLYDWLIVGQVLEVNPAHAVRGPKLVVKKGKTPVLDDEQMVQLIEGINTSHVVGLRDRALIAIMTYTFGRVGAVVAMNVEDYYPNGKRWFVRLHEKGGKEHEMPAHHKLEEYMDAYLTSADIAGQKKTPLFRTARLKTRRLTENRMREADVWRMIRRRAGDVGIATPIGCHTFRATGITNYMKNGGTLEKAQKMAAHESSRTTGLYDRSEDRFTLEEIERVRFEKGSVEGY
jgi:site-specific recombinase XerD